jgi:hypothetical protein
MTLRTADRVRDTTTTTGTGTLTISGTPPIGHRAFSAIPSIAAADTFLALIAHQTLGEWEVSLCTYNSATSIARTTVLSSSNAGALVNFSAGTKDVVLTQTAAREAVGSIDMLDTTASTSSLTGALTVAGGVGIGGDLYVGGTINSITNVASTAFINATNTNVGGGAGFYASSGPNNISLSASQANGFSQFGANGVLYIGTFNNNSVLFMSNNAERARIDGTGNVSIGSGGAYAGVFAETPNLSVNSGIGNFGTFRWANDVFGPTIGLHKSKGAVGTHTIVALNDSLGAIQFSGSDGSVFRQGASISAAVDGTPGASDMPTRLSFATTLDGQPSATERMRINNAGVVSIFNATNSTAYTNGALVISGGVGIAGVVRVNSDVYVNGLQATSGIGCGNITTNDANAGFEHGSTSVANTPFIDFHSSGNSNDNDCRLIADGGSATTGQGNLQFSGAQFNISRNTASTSTTTGALIVAGGVGVAGAGYFGGIVNAPNFKQTTTATANAAVDATATTISIANGANTALASSNGLLIVKDTTNGAIGVYLCEGGSTTMISGGIGGIWVAPTATPAAGKYSVFFTSSFTRIYNNFGSTRSFTAMQLTL